MVLVVEHYKVVALFKNIQDIGLRYLCQNDQVEVQQPKESKAHGALLHSASHWPSPSQALGQPVLHSMNNTVGYFGDRNCRQDDIDEVCDATFVEASTNSEGKTEWASQTEFVANHELLRNVYNPRKTGEK